MSPSTPGGRTPWRRTPATPKRPPRPPAGADGIPGRKAGSRIRFWPASACLARPADRLLRNTAADLGIPAPEDAIRATGGAIPQPVAAIAIADARNARRKGNFSNCYFVFPNSSTCFPMPENAFPMSKKQKTSSKRHSAPGKAKTGIRKTDEATRIRLSLHRKARSRYAKSGKALRKNDFRYGKSAIPIAFRRSRYRKCDFPVRKTLKGTGFSGPQTGHNTAQVCPSKHPDGFREALF